MSGTASRNQTRLTYAPGLRVGSYPGGAMASAPPVQGGAQGPLPVPPVSSAPQAAPPVFVGSGVPAQRMREPWEMGGSGSEGGMAADMGAAVGTPSTGSFLSDLAGFGRVAGPAVAGMLGGPMGIMGLAAGIGAMGVANAFGAPQTRDAIASAIGLDVSQGPPGGTVGDPVGIGAPGAPGLGGAVASDPSQSVKDGLGSMDDGSAGLGGGPVGTDGDKPGTDNAGEANDGGGKGGMGGGEDGGSKGGDFMRGGYTGTGRDGVIQADQRAGTVHEGEVVIPAHAVQQYGLAPLMMLARGQVEPSRLMALLRG